MKGEMLLIVFALILVALTSCEEVIDIDLNSSDPSFVVEGTMYKDSVGLVRLTRTTNYFSSEGPDIIEDAVVRISDGTSSELLTYKTNGYYYGSTIAGTEGKSYSIEIVDGGVTYAGSSFMPVKSDIVSVRYYKDETPGVFNPNGEIIYTITCDFNDDPGIDNYYMIRYILDGAEQPESYYLVTENSANNGTLNDSEIGTISFSESFFYEGGEAEVRVFSIDESVYKYFMQLNDILFWKRRLMPPTPYNPVSNVSNGALGYFAAWAYDSETIFLE